MMEIIEKSNLKTKALIIALIVLLFTCISSICFAAEANYTMEDMKLNRKVYFIGEVTNLFGRVKTYDEETPGCGIIMMLDKKNDRVYIAGEGYIKPEQVIEEPTKFIDFTFGLGTVNLKIEGEFSKVDANGAVRFDPETKCLVAETEGTSNITIIRENGETFEFLATSHNGQISLNIPEQTVSGKLEEANIELANKMVKVEATGDAKATLVIDENGVSVAGEGNGDVKLKVGDQEIANVAGNVTGNVTGNLEGVKGEVNASQTMNFLQNLTLKLTERASGEINKEEVKVAVGGDAEANDTPIASGDAELSYKYGEEDPKANVKAEVLGNEVINMQDKTIPVVSMIKRLIAKISAR